MKLTFSIAIVYIENIEQIYNIILKFYKLANLYTKTNLVNINDLYYNIKNSNMYEKHLVIRIYDEIFSDITIGYNKLIENYTYTIKVYEELSAELLLIEYNKAKLKNSLKNI